MSEENVEIVRRAFDAFNRRDKAAWLADFDADCETLPAKEWPENAPIRGAEACWDFYIQAANAFEEGSFELAEIRDAGDDRVIANQRREMRGKESGASVVYDFWVVVTLRRGKQIRWEWFSTEAEVLEAAELSE